MVIQWDTHGYQNALNLRKFALLPSRWSIFKIAPWDAEKKLYSLYSFLFVWNVLYMSVMYFCFKTSISSLMSLLDFCVVDWSIGKRGVLKYPTSSMRDLFCALSSSNVSFIYGSAFILGTKMFRMQTSSWWTVPVMSIKCPSPSLLINFSLKSTMLAISIATPGFLLGPLDSITFSQSFTLIKYLSLWFRCVSFKL